MERSMLLNSSNTSEAINKNFITQYRTQKHLFTPSNTSIKRSLFRDLKFKKSDIENISESESDLGPMSPLVLTDNSSCDSSPEKELFSSEIFPISHYDYNHLSPKSVKDKYDEFILSSYSLKRICKSAKFSKKLISEFLPQSKLYKSKKNFKIENVTSFPKFTDQSTVLDKMVVKKFLEQSHFDDQESYVAETPQKNHNVELRLITPLGSVSNNIPIPRLHKRKSLGSLKNIEPISPEIKKCIVKRYFENSLSISNGQFSKSDELPLVSKARAALFQDNVSTEKKIEFTLNPRTFYGSRSKTFKFYELGWQGLQVDLKKKRKLYNSIQKHSIKKHKKGEINCGVSHGIKIKRSKLKHQSLNNITKNEKHNCSKNKDNASKENLNSQSEIINSCGNEKTYSRQIYNSKKFFKSKIIQKLVVNIDDKKLNGFIEPQTKHIGKKAKLDEHMINAIDLSINEMNKPSLKQNKAVNILEILENDWSDDKIDPETVKINTLSPKQSNLLKDMSMSPASELSTMASSMNIEDISVCTENLSNNNIVENIEIPEKKLYPLFSKCYSLNNIDNEYSSKKRKRNNDWQLSKKYNSANNQYQIDAGQKMFGAIQCNECRIIYHIGDADDENAHLIYHNSFKSLKFQGWKNERIIYEDYSSLSRIILIEPKDSNLYWNKVNEVLKIVDQELGLSDCKLSFYRNKRIYMYIRNKIILGILVAEYLKTAFEMIPDLIELNCCTTETTSVKCGINVVWIAMSHRRQGIATKLVDVLRANYYYGYIMSISDIAFSSPTISGKKFAEKYTKTRNFKVY